MLISSVPCVILAFGCLSFSMGDYYGHEAITADAVSIALAGVSTVACIVALGVLVYYKMWQKFIYRLVLYILLSLIIVSLSDVFVYSFLIAEAESEATLDIYTNVSISIANGSLAVTLLHTTCIAVCVYLMALHNYHFTYKSDLCLIIPSILYSMIFMIMTLLWNMLLSSLSVVVYLLLGLPISVNIIFTVLTLVPLCCRACGYNLCMKTAATIESHRKALREILPLFILIVPSFFLLMIKIYSIYADVIVDSLGLMFSLAFALHLCFIKKNLKRLQGKKRMLRFTKYGSRWRTHRTTAYTTEGISETCNTDYPFVNESKEDTEFLIKKMNQMQ